MKNYAHLDGNGTVIETFMETESLKLTDLYNQQTAALFIEVPSQVRQGWKIVSGAWQAGEA